MVRLGWVSLVLVCGVAAGCGGAELPAARTAGPLQGCKLTEEPGVRTWECGELLALELAADAATEAEIRQVLDDFAAGFKDATATRTDLAWSRGAQQHPSVRLEGIAPNGQKFVAQMVVVTDAEGSRVVQCASRDAVAPCEPILEHLVGTR
jgi:hypothetical protein